MPDVQSQIPTSQVDLQPAYDRQAWRQGYRSQPQEFDYWIDQIEGEIPSGLEGTLFRNGPGLLDINGQPIHHPFDGDGMISAITFHNGRAHYRNRYVRTAGYLAEQAAGKILYRGVFGTQKSGGWLANAFDLRIKNIANTQVIYWGGKLLALWEAAEPHQLDPKTLDTLGLDNLDGLLSAGDAFAAHPRFDPRCEAVGGAPVLVNFAIKPGLSTSISLYELDTAGQCIGKQVKTVPGFAFIHDFAITPRYAVFFQSPVEFNPLPFVLGWRGAGECVKFRPDRPTRIILIPRSTDIGASKTQAGQAEAPKAIVLETEAGFVFHHANAFEQADGSQIVVDSVCYASFPEVEPGSDFGEVDFDALAPGQLWRFTLDLTSCQVSRELLESRCCEFPALAPDRVGRPYRYVYLGAAHKSQGNAPLQALIKCDLQTGDRQIWSTAPDGFMGEPVFVPRNRHSDGYQSECEDAGWLLALVFDSRRNCSDLVILDAQAVNQGPIARLFLKHHVPYGLHGTFTPQCF